MDKRPIWIVFTLFQVHFTVYLVGVRNWKGEQVQKVFFEGVDANPCQARGNRGATFRILGANQFFIIHKVAEYTAHQALNPTAGPAPRAPHPFPVKQSHNLPDPVLTHTFP